MEANSTLSVENSVNTQETPTPQPISFWKGVGIGLAFLGIQLLVIIPIMIIGFAIFGMDNEEAGINFTMGLGLPLAFIIATWVFYKKRGLINTAFQWNFNFLKLIPLGLVLVSGVSYVVGEAMTYMPDYQALLESYKAMFAGINPIVLIIGGVIIGPICEEIIFRGVILEGLQKKYNPTKAIIFSALIFGLIHLQPLQVISAFFAGLVLGWIYLKTQSLWVCIALHVINNFISFTFEDFGTESTREYFGNDLLYLGSFAVAALIAYLGYWGFKKVIDSSVFQTFLYGENA